MKSHLSFCFSSKEPWFICLLSCIFALYANPVFASSPVVGLWRFDEGSGTNVVDSSGFNNHGILAGENDTTPAWAAGKTGFGGALKFVNDGTSHSYVSIPGTDSLMIGRTKTNAWSITAWAYEDSNEAGDFADTYGRILVLDGGDAFQFESGASSDAQIYSWSRRTATWQIGWGADSAVAPILDEWVHWAVVYDGSSLTIYRNGNQGVMGGKASKALSAALGYTGYTGAIQIGSELAQPANRNWNGLLDEVAVFSGALTEAEVRTIMTGDFSASLGGPAHIITQPASVAIAPGQEATFTAVAQGLSPIQYQWFYNSTNLLANATNATLTLNNVQTAQAGSYSVVASNGLGVDRSLSATLSINVNEALLVGLWRFDEGGGTNVSDWSGLHNNGTLAGENDTLPAWVPGKPGFGSALKFVNDGVNHSYVDVPGSSSLRVGLSATNSWSIAAWAYEDSNGTDDFADTYGRIMVLDDGQAFQLESGASGDAQIYTWTRQDPAWQIGWGTDTPVAPILDEWVHWAAVYNGTNLTLYRNGNQGPQGGIATQVLSAALGYSGYTGAVEIGSELAQPANRNWNGMLDDVAIFNTALSEGQVRTIMTGDFSGFSAQPTLSVRSVAGAVLVSWPSAQTGFQLQSTATFSPAQWVNDLSPTSQLGNLTTATIPYGPGAKFFRLVKF
jgi:hypothetical protein